ncbi:aromatic ring-hydroxylating dioxygenase subunit alpha [Sphingosinicella terrae]|uniref:aromatic ring-hydroxylating dioxygenase subunit alpha n=1 Tax=Sphingosinicella terrae TaxID=2172047 RepID=UPI000E0D0810|nr:aromatic ring-hydroxylating dioxygenase subunit alpha [Sphingosinicella terrae]
MATNIQSVAPRWQPPRAAGERNYPYNCWWVAAFSDEVGRALLGRWLLETPVLLFRKENGEIAAIENRCPHRGAPLSLGCLNGDTVQCGYHGFTFDEAGKCINVPSMRAPLPAAQIRAFPVVEQHPFIWIYLGDPSAIDSVPAPPKLDWAEDGRFAIVSGRLDVEANYMLLKENVLDLTHFGYVHASTFQITDWVDPPAFSTKGETTSYHQTFTRTPLPPVFAEPLGLAPGTLYDRDNYGSFVSPALQVAAVDLKDPDSGEVAGRFRVSHATTPIDERSMYYFWVAGRDHGTSEAELAALKALTERGFAEDETMIEAIEALRRKDPRGAAAPEVSVKMDTAGIQARRIVQRWMTRETA